MRREEAMFGDMGKMMKQAREMQAKLAKVQEQLAQREVQGTAGGGKVVVTMNGRAEVVRIKIDPGAAADVEILEDLILAACRDGHEQVKKIMQSELGGIAGPFSGLLGG
jgi:DNA-binding YbaB/EbfC family protein